jgi:hypothetical protein
MKYILNNTVLGFSWFLLGQSRKEKGVVELFEHDSKSSYSIHVKCRKFFLA